MHKKLEDYTLEELMALHPDDVSIETHGFSAGKWEHRMASLMAKGTPCEGCEHICFRFPYPGMHPCNDCRRAVTKDYYQPEKNRLPL